MASTEECNAMLFPYSTATLTEDRPCSSICPPKKTHPKSIVFCMDNCIEFFQKCVRFVNNTEQNQHIPRDENVEQPPHEYNYLYFIILLSFMLILAIVAFLLLAIFTSRLYKFLKDNHYRVNIFGRVKGPHVQDQSEKDGFVFGRCEEGEYNLDSVSQSNASSASETFLKDQPSFSV